MKFELDTREKSFQVRIDGALVADLALGEAVTAEQRDAELRELRPLRVCAARFGEFLAHCTKASMDELERTLAGFVDGARGIMQPHPSGAGVPPIHKSYEHFYLQGYGFGAFFVSIGRVPVIARTREKPISTEKKDDF